MGSYRGMTIGTGLALGAQSVVYCYGVLSRWMGKEERRKEDRNGNCCVGWEVGK